MPLGECVIAVFDKFMVELNQKDLRLFIMDKTEYRVSVSCHLILKWREI